MKPKLLFLLLALLQTGHSADESCIDRCDIGFDATKQCQCDSLCKYYRSCCNDYESLCDNLTRGDTFPSFPEDEENSTAMAPTHSAENINAMTLPPPRTKHPTLFTTAPPTSDPDAEVCSGRPFNSFMQLKNGSLYAFRGKYFFELDERSVLPGYPKLIEDFWGIKGPIDAAFTRINCQGKTYIFKGSKYWRFDNGVLDEDFPRDISVGFERIPDHLDAAFAIPAHNHNGKEKVYFFKGDRYYQYEFKHQPSHEECIQMSRIFPSALFRRYTDLYYDRWAEHFSQLFSGFESQHDTNHFINKDWIGIKSPVDAVLAGRLYVSPRHLQRPSRRRQDQLGGQHRSQQWNQQLIQQWNQHWNQQGDKQWNQDWNQQWDQQWNQQQWSSHRRQNRSPFWDTMAERGVSIRQEFSQRFGQDNWRDQDRRRNGYQQQYDKDYDYRYNPSEDAIFNRIRWSRPLQSVYFFKGDQYYRFNLQTKRVDYAIPSYPRPIGKYWLGCRDRPGAEKR
ncbi:vitronectin a [Pangasianodon hypophthalmus]|uniref:vitronectin a n=1 Tax=Pangasianodon hypophthalmus TaxID=310915 RepID=UPI000EFE6FB4|nr:vitronectin a [Pangasianodon hypophthalmus]